MKITFLGTSHGGPMPGHYCTSILLESGDFKYLVYAFREEMDMRLLSEATLVDPATGSTLYNLAQQDMIAFRFTMRLGVAIPNPVNRVNATGKRYPFAIILNEKEGSAS